MEKMFKNHKFQFVSFCHVYHKTGTKTDKININNDSHLLHITKGKGVITLNATHNFVLRRGDVIAIPRKTPYTMEIGRDFEMLNLHYQIWLENGLCLDEIMRLPYSFRPAYFSVCERKLRKMCEPTEDGASEAKAVLYKASIAYQIVVEHLFSCELVETKSGVLDERIEKASRYLSSKTCMSYDVEEVTKIACLSKSQLNRKFLETFGVSPHRFWEQERLKEICLQIKQRRKTFAQIADDFNFSSPYYFSRWFKKNASCSPSCFRDSRINY